MSNAIVNVDDFGVTIPAPLEPFTSTIIHPANLAIQERQRDARKLTRHELVDTVREMKALNKLLNEIGYYDQFAEYKLLKQRYLFYMKEAEKLPEGDERTEQLRLMHQVSAKGIAVRKVLRTFQKNATRYELLSAMLKDHQYAIERETIHEKLNKEMANEARKWEGILIDTMARLGFSHDEWDPKKKKTFIHKVSFSEIIITPEAVWLRIFVTRFMVFGSRSALPKHSHLHDIVDEKNLYEYSIACQRQVTAHVSFLAGAWLCVHRLGTTDGILNYVTLEQVLNAYPYENRGQMPIPIGVGEGKEISWIMLPEHPHFLVGGSTGNGKSNVTHVIICSLIQFQSPKELRLCLIDLKDGAEFAPYAKIPHLIMPIIRKPEQAVNVLAQMEALRNQRMEIIAEAGCANILEYNDRFPDKAMPRIVIFVDEYARLKARGVELQGMADRASGEITALGRAAGVHFFAATQTPYSAVLPGETKNNMTVRIALPMETLEASRSILGNGDALKLPGGTIGRAWLRISSLQIQIQIPHARPQDKQKSIEAAYDWDEAPPLALPEIIRVDVFDEAELLDIAINELGGNLGAKPIYNFIKDSRTLSQSEVREMVKKIIERGKTEKVIVFEGYEYELEKAGTGYRLKSGNPVIQKSEGAIVVVSD